MTRTDVLPPVFDPVVEPEWKTFVEHFRIASSENPVRTGLYLCIEFARYMRAIRVPPFRTPFRDPLTHLQFQPDKAYEQLFKAVLTDFQTAISSEVRKLRLHDLVLVQTRFHVDVPMRDGQDLVMKFTLLVKPEKNQQLTSNLLVNPTFSSGSDPSTDLALQLRNSKKLQRADDLMVVKSELGWLKLRSSPLKVLVQRGREEHLVVRMVQTFPREIMFGTPSQTKTKINQLWTALTRTTRFGPKL